MVKIKKFKKSDTIEVALLIKNTSEIFFKNECFIKNVAQKYANSYDPKNNSKKEILEKFKKSTIFYVAKERNKIIGMIRGKQDRIANLFVYANYHRKEVGRKLVEKFEMEAVKLGSKKIKIHSSLYALSFYEKMGYKKSTGIRNFYGLKTQPMKKSF